MFKFRFDREVTRVTPKEEEVPSSDREVFPFKRRRLVIQDSEALTPRASSSRNHSPALLPSSNPLLSHPKSVPVKLEVAPVKPETPKKIAFRPKVAAADRIRSWSTPFSLESDSLLRSSLPHNLVLKLQNTIFKALAPNTRNAYGAGILRFNEFCDKYMIPEEQRMPASHTLLAAFIADHSGSCSGSCVKNWLSGIKAWHDFHGAPWHGDNRMVHLACSTASKEGTSFSRLKRHPITKSHLIAIHSRIDQHNATHIAFWALALSTFWGCRRLGELTIPSLSSFDSKMHVTRSTNVTFKMKGSSPSSISFCIPWTKSTREKGGEVILTTHSDILCPVTALLLHLKARYPYYPAEPCLTYHRLIMLSLRISPYSVQSTPPAPSHTQLNPFSSISAKKTRPQPTLIPSQATAFASEVPSSTFFLESLPK